MGTSLLRARGTFLNLKGILQFSKICPLTLDWGHSSTLIKRGHSPMQRNTSNSRGVCPQKQKGTFLNLEGIPVIQRGVSLYLRRRVK